MRKLIATVSLLILIGPTHARTPMQPKTLKSEVNTAFIDKVGPFAGKRMISGDVIVNQKDRELTLFLVLGPVCTPLLACPSYMQNEVIKLQNMKGAKDICGVETYSAELNKMPVDGIKQELIVVDYSKSTCPTPHYLPYVDTKITYKTTRYNRRESRPIKSNNVFYAEKLEVSEVVPLHNY